jgi:hypothetical protein
MSILLPKFDHRGIVSAFKVYLLVRRTLHYIDQMGCSLAVYVTEITHCASNGPILEMFTKRSMDRRSSELSEPIVSTIWLGMQSDKDPLFYLKCDYPPTHSYSTALKL